MKCEQYQSLLSTYSDGVLSEADRARVDQHLERCEHCQREGRALQRMKVMLSYCAETPVPTDLVSRIMDAAQRTPLLPSATCDEVVYLLSPYIDNELDEINSRRVLNHMAVCDDCYAELHTLEQQSALVGVIPALRAPAALKEAILERVAHQPQGWFAHLLNRARAAGTLPPRWSYGFAAAATAVLAVVCAPYFGRSPALVAQSPKRIEPSPTRVVLMSPATQSSETKTEDAHRAEPGSLDMLPVQPAILPPTTGGVTVTPASLPMTSPKAVAPPNKMKPHAKSRPQPGGHMEAVIKALDNGAKPNSNNFNLPEEALSAPSDMKDMMNNINMATRMSDRDMGNGSASETDEDVTSLLVSTPTLPYDTGLNLPEDGDASAPPTQAASASRKIPLKNSAFPLPQGSEAKGSATLRGRRMDGLPRRAIIASFGS